MAGITAGISSGRFGPRTASRTDANIVVWHLPGFQRVLQLALAAAWLFDAVLQLQPFMFSRAFGGQMLAATANGNPSGIARSITWATSHISVHSVAAGTAFAVIQLLIGLLIAWRPTLRAGLAISIPWSIGVWWVGEGAGGVFTSQASPLMGAPGAVLIYALLAVLLWPSGPRAGERCLADRPLGASVARAAWAVLWCSMAFFALLASNRAPDGLSHMIAGMAPGGPPWLTALDNHVAHALAGDGLAASIVLALLCVVVGVGILGPVVVARGVLVMSGLLAAAIWVVGEAFGGIFSGAATDPNSGPLLMLLAAAYWPLYRSEEI
jgi:hypothetical protein